MLEAYKKMFVNYTNFKDRTSRKDFWLAFLMNIIVYLVFSFVCGFIAGIAGVSLGESGVYIVYIIYIYPLIALIPGIAMVVRRLHDINKSGWYWFIGLIPVVGELVLLYFECLPSVEENNNYGVQL